MNRNLLKKILIILGIVLILVGTILFYSYIDIDFEKNLGSLVFMLIIISFNPLVAIGNVLILISLFIKTGNVYKDKKIRNIFWIIWGSIPFVLLIIDGITSYFYGFSHPNAWRGSIGMNAVISSIGFSLVYFSPMFIIAIILIIKGILGLRKLKK